MAAVNDERYYRQITTGFSGYRWVDYSLSAALMVVTNEVLWFAPPDINTLALTVFVQALMVLAGGAAAESWWCGPGPPYSRSGVAKDDANGRAGSTRAWIAYVFAVSALAFAWMWGRYAWVLVRGASSGAGTVPVFVYIILVLLGTSFAAFPAIFLAKLWGDPLDIARNLRYEARFWLASALAKIPLLSFFASGLISRRSRVAVGTAPGIPSDDDAYEGLYAAAGAAVLVAAVVGLLLRISDTNPPRVVSGGYWAF